MALATSVTGDGYPQSGGPVKTTFKIAVATGGFLEITETRETTTTKWYALTHSAVTTWAALAGAGQTRTWAVENEILGSYTATQIEETVTTTRTAIAPE